jgi:hypothetical protein
VKRSVLIVAEGEHELAGGTADAALPILVKRLLGDGVDLRPTSKRIRELSGYVHPGRGNPLARKFIGIMRLAERQGFDAVVVLIDQDDDVTRHQSAAIAQETQYTLLPRAIGIAVHTFDAWFLSDHKALSDVLCTTIPLQPTPERLTDPKSVCQSLTTVATNDCRLRDLYSMIAAVADLNIMKQKCPKGFGVFAERVANLRPS